MPAKGAAFVLESFFFFFLFLSFKLNSQVVGMGRGLYGDEWRDVGLNWLVANFTPAVVRDNWDKDILAG